MPSLYIIAGPNGAGKTTASYTILPDILYCKEFVNADEIAKGLSPFNPESVSISAGRLMLMRINELLKRKESFAFETTLSTKSYVQLIHKAKEQGYKVILLFLALESVALAYNRVRVRVEEGGHHIPENIIYRRFYGGLGNFFRLYQSIVDEWIFVDNSTESFNMVANGKKNEVNIRNLKAWSYYKKNIK